MKTSLLGSGTIRDSKSFDRHFQYIHDRDTLTALRKRDGGWMTWINFFPFNMWHWIMDWKTLAITTRLPDSCLDKCLISEFE